MEVTEDAKITKGEFEPDPSGVGYIAQVHAFIPDELLSTTYKRRQQPIRYRYVSDSKTVDLKVCRGFPRRPEVRYGEYPVEVEVEYGEARSWWQRAPKPEKVARKILSILDA